MASWARGIGAPARASRIISAKLASTRSRAPSTSAAASASRICMNGSSATRDWSRGEMRVFVRSRNVLSAPSATPMAGEAMQFGNTIPKGGDRAGRR